MYEATIYVDKIGYDYYLVQASTPEEAKKKAENRVREETDFTKFTVVAVSLYD